MKNDNILNMSEKNRLAADIMLMMLKGSGYAAVFVLAVWFVIAAMAFSDRILSEESRDTPDPINRASLLIESEAAVHK